MGVWTGGWMCWRAGALYNNRKEGRQAGKQAGGQAGMQTRRADRFTD